MTKYFKDETLTFISDWVSGDTDLTPSLEIIDDLKKTIKNELYTLYRKLKFHLIDDKEKINELFGNENNIQKNDKIKLTSKKYQSWSTNENYGRFVNFPKLRYTLPNQLVINLVCIVNMKKVLADLNDKRISKSFDKDNDIQDLLKSENEVITFSGEFHCIVDQITKGCSHEEFKTHYLK